LVVAPPSSTDDETRLIAAIQHVSQLQFSTVINMKYRFGKNPQDCQMRFINPRQLNFMMEAPSPAEAIEVMSDANIILDKNSVHPETPKEIAHVLSSLFLNNHSIRSRLKEKHIFLTPPLDRFHEEELLPILVHNLSIEQKTPLKDVLKRMFQKNPPSKDFLKDLWNDVNEAHKRDLLDLYVETLYSALKPSLDLNHLKLFCAHLALDQVCFIHAEAKALYDFLKGPAVARVFTHPEVLTQMIEKFPTVYPAVIEGEELEKWRVRASQQLARFFDGFGQISSPMVTALMKHLKECCDSLRSLEEMETGFTRIFVQEHSFKVHTASMQTLDSLLNEAKELFQESCPKPLQHAYLYLQKILAQYLTFSSHLEEHESMLARFQIEEQDPVNRLMNILWKLSFTSLDSGWDQPIPVPLQVEWLSILNDLELDIDLSRAAKLLAADNNIQEGAQTHELTLALRQLKSRMLERQLSLKAIHLFTHFQPNESSKEETFNADTFEEQEQQALIPFLHEEEVIQLTTPHPELEQLRQRLLNALEPTLLSRSYLFLSQIVPWNK
jgi:hypothetical protein